MEREAETGVKRISEPSFPKCDCDERASAAHR